MRRHAALVLSALVLGAGLAGCLGGAEDDAEGDDARPGGGAAGGSGGSSSAGSGTTPTPRPINMSKRWHFHNYWGASDNLTLYDGPLVLQAAEVSVAAPRALVGGATFVPREGAIVPPETGWVTVEVTWNGTLPPRPVDLAYRAANMTAFLPGGRAFPGPATVNVTEAMADAPHTGASGWAFRLLAGPDENGLAVANGTVHVRAVAWLGRPIIIDPPHRDQWGGVEVLPLAEATFEGRATKTARGYVVAEGAAARTQESVLAVLPPNGTVVPEGATAIVVRLAWTQTAPLPVPPGLAVAWREGQTLTSGVATKEEATATSALYRILVDTKTVDSPYSARSAWRLDVVLDDTTPAFEGKLTVEGWVAKQAGWKPT